MTDVEVTATETRLAWETPELVDLSKMLDDVKVGNSVNTDGTDSASEVFFS